MNYFRSVINSIRQNRTLSVVVIVMVIVIIALICVEVCGRLTGTNNTVTKNENFNIHDKDPSNAQIVLYYTSWCGYSQQFLPIWSEFEEYAKANLPKLLVRKVLCEGDDESYCQQKRVDGFPTVIIYPKEDTEVVFTGERNKESLVEFAKRNLK